MKKLKNEKVIKALLEGKKIRHWTDGPNDYCYYKQGFIYNQDGSQMDYDLGMILYSISNTTWYLYE